MVSNNKNNLLIKQEQKLAKKFQIEEYFPKVNLILILNNFFINNR